MSSELHEIWPIFTRGKSTDQFVFEIILQINEHFRERIPVWSHFIERPEHFADFFDKVIILSLKDDLAYSDQTICIEFLNNCFNSMEVELVRKEVGKLCSLPVWINLFPSQRNVLLDANPKIKKLWNKIEKKIDKFGKEEFEKVDFNRRYMWRLMQKFIQVVHYIDSAAEFDIDAVKYCERFLLLLIDLDSQLATRRFLNSLILSSHLLTYCYLSQFIRNEYGTLFFELIQLLKFYVRFEIDDLSGLQLTPLEVVKRHYKQMTDLQKATFQHFRKHDSVTDFALLSVGSIDSSGFLRKHLGSLSAVDLYKIADYLHIVPSCSEVDSDFLHSMKLDNAQFLLEEIILYCEKKPNQLQKLNSEPLYPSEIVIWDERLVPYDNYDGKSVLPLNRLNIQFLTLHDYLLRNFNLFKAESTYEIRCEIEDVLFRMKPWLHESGDPGEVVWGGWARMALPISGTRIVSVVKPLVGETAPAEIKADIKINLPKRSDFREEWQMIRKNDVLFLLKVLPKHPIGYKFDPRLPFKSQFDVVTVRGCEVEGILGNEGQVVDEFESRDIIRRMDGDIRTYRVCFDPNQYHIDAEKGLETDLYFSFNLIVRREPKTNNFRSVLSTIRELLNTEFVVPDWLQEIILGYGEPDAAHYTRMNDTIPSVDFNDTFLSFEHLKLSFPGKEIICDENNPSPPFKLTFKEFEIQHDLHHVSKHDTTIVVEHQKKFNRVVTEKHHCNETNFTPAQIEAIKSGMQPGLTIVVGPPGTGKTDVAVQIISNIYHNWPEQRTLVVTHSNQALNALFEKIIRLDVDERHLLRMGHGEGSLETTKDFSRYGRVDYILSERMRLLRQVEVLRESLNEVGDVSYSCETAGYFYRYNICKAWESFENGLEFARTNGINDYVSKNFPFTCFFEFLSRISDFSEISNPIDFTQEFEGDLAIASEAWFRIKDIFKKLDEFRAFELLRNGRERADYLLVKEAKIIAMTCTYAALRRHELVELGFHYDNILMEEAAQILEIETFIPLLLQDPHDGRYRLKRWIMIGDHHQLPPIVQNVAYQKFGNMEQSLFSRFIRLGVPHVQLDAQGRARSEIAQLYNWRYNNLGDLPHVLTMSSFIDCNPGFGHTFQLIDVPDFNGIGESTPSPHFYQNLGEAEFAVALFVYMRIIGYPASKIVLLTTYNGQVALLRDIVSTRCSANPLIGEPSKISTVDRYQGQQNDYVILSLVRTKHVGHIRDVRRLIVALSRARLGLYMLGRVSLFKRCYDLRQALQRILVKPTQLELLPDEMYTNEVGNQRKKDDTLPPTVKIFDTAHMSYFVAEFYRNNIELLKNRLVENSKEVVPKLISENEDAKLSIPEKQQEVENSSNSQKITEQSEGEIVFEQVDFERLKETPKC